MAARLNIPPEFDSASKEQRIEFVQRLWDRIAQDPERVPVPAEHQRILDERLAELQSDAASEESWSAARERLLAKLRNS